MSYFRSGFIQRLIDYMWDSQLVKFYNIVSGMYLLSYLLILSACVMLRWTDSHPYGSASVRATLLGVNMLVLILSLCTFEIKSLMADGLDYFSSFWNKNDMMLFALSAANLAQEIVQMNKFKGKPLPGLRGDPEEDFVATDWYVYDISESVMRVTYSLMIVSVHFKILNVLSFYGSVAFLVKIMEKLV